MRIIRKDSIKEPVIDSKGEEIYELIGSAEKSGGSVKHSLAYEVMPGCSSKLHYHSQDEEGFFILKGSANLFIDGKEHPVKAGDAIFIQPQGRHQIFTTGGTGLEFIVVCAPAWQSSYSVFL